MISERRTGLIPAGAGQTRNGAQSTSRFWAHPRRCGADQCAQKQILDGMGSSPQVRGRRQPGSEASPFSGLIPAGAGQTRTRHGERRRGRAHPRRCGADRTAPGRTPVPHGSSPQVRGRLHVERHVGARRGLIPAGAGQTPDNFTSGYGQRAHPRRCGADDWALPHDTVFPGSSPQVRGRPAAVHPSQPAPGLIPAGAGQTRCVLPAALGRTAHPRRCGADWIVIDHDGYGEGSSPQVRGRRSARSAALFALGLIPAGAGQTITNVRYNFAATAHPRRCGADDYSKSTAGSYLGLIPAGAGQTTQTVRPPHLARAHPRRCGADGGASRPSKWVRGSSPQVRGRPLATSNVASAKGSRRTTWLSHSDDTPRVRGKLKPPFYYGSSLLHRCGETSRSRLFLQLDCSQLVKRSMNYRILLLWFLTRPDRSSHD